MRPQIYSPLGGGGRVSVVVRASGDPGSIVSAVVAAVVTSIVMFFLLHTLEQRGLLAFLGAGWGGGAGTVEVPSILGMQPDQARELLKGRGLLFTLSAERENTSYPAGTVAEQSPLPGSQVQRAS